MTNALTVKEVAQRLQIRPHGVRALIKSGQLPGSDISLHVGGRPRFRILESDLEAFILSRTHEPQAKRRRRRRKDESITEYF